MLNIISNPVNSTVPIAAEALKKMGVYDKRKLLGVTTLDVVRGHSSRRRGGQAAGRAAAGRVARRGVEPWMSLCWGRAGVWRLDAGMMVQHGS